MGRLRLKVRVGTKIDCPYRCAEASLEWPLPFTYDSAVERSSGAYEDVVAEKTLSISRLCVA
eukprot:6317955-Amphidinium_carterae.2